MKMPVLPPVNSAPGVEDMITYRLSLTLVRSGSGGRAPAQHGGPPLVHRGDRQLGIALAQLKIMQEVITLTVFVPFAVLYMRQPVNLNFLWAGLCLLGAVYFMFR